MEIIWTYDFVQNEYSMPLYEGVNSVFSLINKPVVAGTLSGEICKGVTQSECQIQTFKTLEDGTLVFADVHVKNQKCIEGYVNIDTGIITLVWNCIPPHHHIMATYEHDPYAHLK